MGCNPTAETEVPPRRLVCLFRPPPLETTRCESVERPFALPGRLAPRFAIARRELADSGAATAAGFLDRLLHGFAGFSRALLNTAQ